MHFLVSPSLALIFFFFFVYNRYKAGVFFSSNDNSALGFKSGFRGLSWSSIWILCVALFPSDMKLLSNLRLECHSPCVCELKCIELLGATFINL